MSNNDGGDLGAFLAGFMVGGLVGAAVSLLLAPQSGEVTRDQIRTKGIELRGQAEDEIRDIRVRAEQTLAEVRAQADEIQENALRTIEDARTKVSSAIDQGVEAARNTREELSNSRKSKAES